MNWELNLLVSKVDMIRWCTIVLFSVFIYILYYSYSVVNSLPLWYLIDGAKWDQL